MKGNQAKTAGYIFVHEDAATQEIVITLPQQWREQLKCVIGKPAAPRPDGDEELEAVLDQLLTRLAG